MPMLVGVPFAMAALAWLYNLPDPAQAPSARRPARRRRPRAAGLRG